MKHLDRLLLKVVIFLCLMAGSLAAYTKGEYFFINNDFYIVRENGEIFPASSDQFGIEKSKADFLTHFRKNISPGTVSLGRDHIDTTKEHIKSGLLEDYARDGQRLNEWTHFSSDRERFIAYLMLRVNGSLPIYSVKPVNDDLHDNLLSKEGNCSHQAYRMLMVLDIFSIKGQLVSWWSPAIEGHVFVDAVDPIEGRSYFLDPTSNLMASTQSDEQNLGFLQSIDKVSPSNRKAFLSTRMKEFPNFVTASQGLNQDFMMWSLNNYLRAKDSIITGFSFEFPVMQSRWRDGKNPLPKTLCELADQGSQLIQDFQPTSCLPPAISPT